MKRLARARKRGLPFWLDATTLRIPPRGMTWVIRRIHTIPGYYVYEQRGAWIYRLSGPHSFEVSQVIASAPWLFEFYLKHRNRKKKPTRAR